MPTLRATRSVPARGAKIHPVGFYPGRVAKPARSDQGRAGQTRAGQVLGTVTRGTTNANRLRRLDRWLAGPQAHRLRRAEDPLVVDLGYGASGVTALELRTRLARVRADVEVVGLEIDPARVVAAQPLAGPGLSFRRGGFELPLDGRRPVVVRAFNVLRQYPVEQVETAWTTMCRGLAPGGLLVEGTCDELGRRCCWVAVTPEEGPVSLTFSTRLRDLGSPSELAERLPKVLIHRNVPGEPIHAALQTMDDAWARNAPQAAFGVRQRWLSTVADLAERGWPVLDGKARWRLGEVTLAWHAVAPSN